MMTSRFDLNHSLFFSLPATVTHIGIRYFKKQSSNFVMLGKLQTYLSSRCINLTTAVRIGVKIIAPQRIDFLWSREKSSRLTTFANIKYQKHLFATSINLSSDWSLSVSYERRIADETKSLLFQEFLYFHIFLYLFTHSDHQLSLQVISLMFTSTLNPNSSTSTSKNSNSINSQTHLELGKFLLTHDPSAIRLYDYINHVKVFLYNSNEFRWENNSYIEGNLFSYERRQITNNQAYPSYAFAIINQKQIFIQQITSDMSLHSDKLRLFYEITKNNKHEVFGLHFANENESHRLDAFVERSIQSIRNFKEQSITTNELQSAQTAVNVRSSIFLVGFI